MPAKKLFAALAAYAALGFLFGALHLYVEANLDALRAQYSVAQLAAAAFCLGALGTFLGRVARRTFYPEEA